jgi:hypothetical protein
MRVTKLFRHRPLSKRWCPQIGLVILASRANSPVSLRLFSYTPLHVGLAIASFSTRPTETIRFGPLARFLRFRDHCEQRQRGRRVVAQLAQGAFPQLRKAARLGDAGSKMRGLNSV